MNVQCPACETVYRVDPAKVPDDGIRARCTVCTTMIPVRRDAAPVTRPAPDVAPAAPSAAAQPPPARPAPAVTPPAPVPPPTPPPTPRPSREAPPPPRRVTQPFFQQRGTSGSHQVAPADPEPAPPPPAPARPSAPVFRPTPGQPVTPAPQPPTPSTARPPRQTPPRQPTAKVPSAPVGAPAAPAPSAAGPAEEKKHVNPFLARDPRQKARRLARALVSDMIVYQPEKRQQALAQGNLKAAFEDEILKSWQEYVEQVGEELANSTPYWNEALNEILAGGQTVF